jgi:Zinc knuckle
MSAKETRTLRAEIRGLKLQVMDLQSRDTTQRDELRTARARVTELETNGADAMLRTERDDAVTNLVTAKAELARANTTNAGHLLTIEALIAERDEFREDLTSMEEDFAAKAEFIKELETSNAAITAEGERIASVNEALNLQLKQVIHESTTRPTLAKNTVKFKAPEPFDGTGDYREWMRKVKLFLRYSKVTTDEEMIEVTLSYISGDAAKTMEDYFQWAEEKSDLGPFTDFEETLRSTYDNKDRVMEARHKLELLGHTSTMAKYAAEFKTLSALSGFSQADLMHRYELKMHGKYKTLLRRYPLKPTTLEELISWSLKTAQVETQAQEIEDASRPQQAKGDKATERQGGWKQKKAQAAAATATTTPTTTTATKVTPSPAMSETRKCFNCNETGHLASACPKPKKTKEGEARINATGTNSQSMQEQMDELRAHMKDMNQMFNHAMKQIPTTRKPAATPTRDEDF